MNPAEIYTIIGIISACGGLASGIAIGAWTVSAKNADLKAHGKAIDSISARCERQKETILTEVKTAICDAMKIALRDLKGEIREQQTATDRELAVTVERVNQTERDIEIIFSRLLTLEKKP